MILNLFFIKILKVNNLKTLVKFGSIVIFVTIVFYNKFAYTQMSVKDRATRELKKIQQQEEILKEKDLERLRELQKRKKPKKRLELEKKKELKISPEIERGWKINKIVLVGATLLKQKEKSKIINKYVGKYMKIKDINALLNDITQLYFKKGYITTRAYIAVGQNLSTGVLKIIVVEGKLEDILLKDNKGGKSVALDYAFPGLKGKVLNLRDIEQGLEQINRLASNNATIQIKPGKEIGASTLVVINKARDPYTYSMGFNNLGYTSTGDSMGSLSIVVDNPIGINDSFGILFRRSMPFFDLDKYSSSLSANYSVPYGYWTFSLSASNSDYVTRIPLSSGHKAKLSGSTRDISGMINRVLYRDQISRFEVYGKFTTKKVLNYLQENLILVSSYGIAFLEVGFNYNTLLFGGLMDMNFGYNRGVDPSIFSINGEIDGQSERGIDMEFNKFTGNIGYKRPLQIGTNNIVFSSRVTAQTSGDDVLPSSEQISIGGFYSIRGFQDDTLSGDTGGYLQNEIVLTPGILCNRLGLREKVSLVFAYDVGKIWKHKGSEDGFLSGCAYGIRLNTSNISLEIMNSHPISYPDSFPDQDDKFYVLLSTVGSIELGNRWVNSLLDNKWFVGVGTGEMTFKLNDVYVAGAHYRTTGSWWYSSFIFGKAINRSRIYLSIYDLNTPNDIDAQFYSINFDTKFLNTPVYPYVGVSAGYGSYKEKELEKKNPLFVIEDKSRNKKDSIYLRGFTLGVKLGIKANWKNFKFSFDYMYSKLFNRDTIYWDGVAENFEIKAIHGWNFSVAYLF